MISTRLQITALAILASFCPGFVRAQEGRARTPSEAPAPQLTPGSERKAVPPAQPPSALTVALTVPRQASLAVALDREIRIRRVGQTVTARLVDPLYAFDRLVVPAGSEVKGVVTQIGPLSRTQRALAGLDANFSPTRAVDLTFHELILPGGIHMPLHTTVTPGSGEVMQLVSAPDKGRGKSVKDAASEKTNEATRRARCEWDNAMKQLRTPGRIHRLARYAEAQLPVHAQYIPAGTVYFAELQEPLSFGSESLPVEKAASIGGPLPEGSVVHARLLTGLSSATAQKGQPVEAVLIRPLFDGDRLIYPQGSRLVGNVGQVRPARRFKKNGQLRIAFHQAQLPDGVEQKIQAALVGVQTGKEGNIQLDSEGGAEATTPKSRYLNTTVSLGLAFLAGRGDPDSKGPDPTGSTGGRVAGGAGGFKLVGMVLGAVVPSRAFGYGMGAYGAGRSIYSNFLTRGREVVFPKNTAMDIGVETRATSGAPDASEAALR